jgi:hypothetical protein
LEQQLAVRSVKQHFPGRRCAKTGRFRSVIVVDNRAGDLFGGASQDRLSAINQPGGSNTHDLQCKAVGALRCQTG